MSSDTFIVSSLPRGVTREHVLDHFQAVAQGRDTVDYVLHPIGNDNSMAVVKIASNTDSDRIARKEHYLHGSRLLLTPMPKQVFVQCRGEIDPLVLASVPHLPSCIKMLQSEFGLKVKVKESPTQLLLQGSLLQLQCAQVKLHDIYRQQLELQQQRLLQAAGFTTGESKRSRSNKSTPRSSRSSQQNGNLDNRRQNGSHDNGRENGNLDDRTHEFGTSTGRMKVSDFLSQSLEPRGERTLQPDERLIESLPAEFLASSIELEKSARSLNGEREEGVVNGNDDADEVLQESYRQKIESDLDDDNESGRSTPEQSPFLASENKVDELFSTPTPKPPADVVISQSLDDLDPEYHSAFSSARKPDPHDSIDWVPHTPQPVVPSRSYDEHLVAPPRQNGETSRNSTPRSSKSNRESPRSHTDSPRSNRETPRSNRESPRSNRDSPKSNGETSRSHRESARSLEERILSPNLSHRSNHSGHDLQDDSPRSSYHSARSHHDTPSSSRSQKQSSRSQCVDNDLPTSKHSARSNNGTSRSLDITSPQQSARSPRISSRSPQVSARSGGGSANLPFAASDLENTVKPIHPRYEPEVTRSAPPLDGTSPRSDRNGILLECEPYVVQYLRNIQNADLAQIERDYDVKLRVHGAIIEVVSVDDTDLTAELARDKLSQLCKRTAQEIVTESIALPPGEREAQLMQGTLQQGGGSASLHAGKEATPWKEAPLVQSAYKKEIVFDTSDLHEVTLIGKAKPVTLATEYIKSMTGMRSRTPRSSSRDSETPRPSPKMLFIMESQNPPAVAFVTGNEGDVGLSETRNELSTQAFLQMTEVQNSALQTGALDTGNLDTLGSLLVTKTEGYALESSQPKEGDTVDFNDLDANQFDDVDGHQNEATVDLAQDDGMKWDDDDYTHARGNRMEFSLGSTGSTMGAPPRVHPPGASGLRLEFGSMGSTKAEKLIGTGETEMSLGTRTLNDTDRQPLSTADSDLKLSLGFLDSGAAAQAAAADKEAAKKTRQISAATFTLKGTSHVKSFHHGTPEGVVLTVNSGDILRESGEVLVCPVTPDLQMDDGIGLLVSQAAGPDYQTRCNEFVDEHGRLNICDVAPLEAQGELRCRFVLHVVPPLLTDAINPDASVRALTEAYTNVLDYVNNSLKSSSVVIPELGTDVGFPVEVGAQALLDAVVQFLTDLPPDSALRHVMIINKDEHVSSVIASAFEQVFGDDHSEVNQNTASMIESQGHFKGQTVHRSTLAGQTLQDSLNYRGQQQLSQDLTVTGGVGWATPKSTGRSSIDDDTDQTIPKQHLLSKVAGLRTETAWLDSLELPPDGGTESLQNTPAFNSSQRHQFDGMTSQTLTNAEEETPREDALPIGDGMPSQVADSIKQILPGYMGTPSPDPQAVRRSAARDTGVSPQGVSPSPRGVSPSPRVRSALDNVDLGESLDDDAVRNSYDKTRSARSPPSRRGSGVSSPSPGGTGRGSQLVGRASPRDQRQYNAESLRVTKPDLRQSPQPGSSARSSPATGRNNRESPVSFGGQTPRSVRSQQGSPRTPRSQHESPRTPRSPTRSHQNSPRTSRSLDGTPRSVRSQHESPRTSRSQQASPSRSQQGTPRPARSQQGSPRTGRSPHMSPRNNVKSPDVSGHRSRSHTPRSIKSPLVTPRAELVTGGSSRTSPGIKGSPRQSLNNNNNSNSAFRPVRHQGDTSSIQSHSFDDRSSWKSVETPSGPKRSSWSPRPDRGSAGSETGDGLSGSRPFTAVRPEDLTLPRPFTAAGSAVDLSQSRPFTSVGPMDASQTFESPRSSVVGRIQSPRGAQPNGGEMTWEVDRRTRLPGYEDVATIVITFSFPSGKQELSDETYRGLTQNAFLPNTPEGRRVLIDLKRAFDLGMVFTLSSSGNIILGGIPLKPQISGGPERGGYPDPTYMARVSAALQQAGIRHDH